MDDSNWKEDYKGYKHLNKKQRDLYRCDKNKNLS